MICPECYGRGKAICFVETHRDENSVTVAKRVDICHACHGSGEVLYTNAHCIRAMSDEELADWLARTQTANIAEALAAAKIPYEPEDGLKDEVAKECMEWLKQPAEPPKGEAT